MLYFDRTDVSEGIDVNKTSACLQCMSVMLVTIGISLIIILSFNQMSAIDIIYDVYEP